MSNSAKPNRVAVLKATARIKLHAAADEDNDTPAPAAQAPPTEGTGVDEPGDQPVDLRLEEPPDMDPEEVDDPDALVDEDDEAFTLDDVIKCFLRANPTPTDEQVHAFAELMGMRYEEFEAQVFKKFGEVVRQATSLGPSEEEEDEDEDGMDEDTDDGVDDDDLDPDEDDQDDEDQELQADDELDVQDDVDMFVVAYILFNSEPSDEQIHQLAFVVGITKEQMEQRIYRMLGSFFKLGDDGDQVDDEEDQEGEDEGGADDTDEGDDPETNGDDDDEGETK